MFWIFVLFCFAATIGGNVTVLKSSWWTFVLAQQPTRLMKIVMETAHSCSCSFGRKIHSLKRHSFCASWIIQILCVWTICISLPCYSSLTFTMENCVIQHYKINQRVFFSYTINVKNSLKPNDSYHSKTIKSKLEWSHWISKIADSA